MFGLKIRSWMETHLVRSKKKRNKDGTKSKQEKSPPDHIAVVNNEFEYKSAKSIESKKVSPVSTIKTQTTEHSSSSLLKTQSPFTCVVNLSSPESAYSTGYSTDGTSPGTSLPPEYYINIRTGTHYFQSNHHKVEKLTPRSARRKKEELKRKKCTDGNNATKHLPESSTEDEILNADCPAEDRRSTHRRTESCDETNLTSNLIPPSSSPIPPYQCSSPYLPGTSPRPRNRIRTNPWLPTSPTGGKLPLNGDTYAVDSSSTVSSNDCREKHGSPQKKVASPRKKPKPTAVDNANKTSPIVNKRSVENVITTCSPLSSRHCPHVNHTREGSSSSPISSSDDDNHGNTSDFSDDDVTLNEILGKYDESYTYEKETDILSDSDLTDSEDHNKRGSDFLRRDLREDFEFIDLVQSENNSPMFGKRMNTGHCYYHQLGEKLNKQRSNDSRSSSRGSSIAKRSKKSESEKRKKLRNVNQEEKNPSHFNASSPNPRIEKSLNLNKTLVERLNQTQSRGTRSANTTPLTARKKLTENGKYLKNDYIINLINSNMSLSEKSRNSYNNINERKYSLNTTNSGSLEELQYKKRSHSLCQEISSEPDDLKYKKLTEEANYIIEKLENSKYKSVRRVISAENSPTRSTNLNEPRKFSQNVYSPSKNMSSIKLRENIQANCADADRRNYHNSENVKNWSPLKVSLLKQGLSHVENRTSPNKHFNHVNNRVQNMNNNIHTMSSSPVKFKLQNATSADNHDLKIFSNLTNSPLRSKFLRDAKNRCAYNSYNLESKIKYSEANGTLERCENINDCPQTVDNTSNVRLDNRNRKDIKEIGYKDKNKNIYAIPFEHLNVESNSLPVTYSSEHSNGYWEEEITSRYYEEPAYENINMKAFSRDTPSKIQYPYPIDDNQSPCKIAINTQTYKLSKPKFSSPMNQRTPLITFQKRLPVTRHTRSIADIMNEENKQKSVLLNFRSLDLGNNSTESYCPRSEPVKRKVYAHSNSYGKLQKSLKGNLLRDTEIYSNQLRNSVAQIRKERFYVEAKLRKTQQQINKIKNESQV